MIYKKYFLTEMERLYFGFDWQTDFFVSVDRVDQEALAKYRAERAAEKEAFYRWLTPKITYGLFIFLSVCTILGFLYFSTWSLSHLLILILFAIFFISGMGQNFSLDTIRKVSYFFSLMIFLYSLFLFYFYDVYGLTEVRQLSGLKSLSYFLSSDFTLSVDGLSIFFILLTTFITPLCLLISWNVVIRLKEYILCFFYIEFFLVLAFLTDDLLVFFIAFEFVLIPMYLIIGVWGSRVHKTVAAYWFFLFTLSGSIFFLYVLVSFYLEFGTTSVSELKVLLWASHDAIATTHFYWFCLFIAFAVKIPLFPFHVWLPEAHVEAPTAGSVVLASLLLKLGGYGIIKFLIGIFPDISYYYITYVYFFCALGVIYGSLTAIRQMDFKRLIAYSSVAHMNYVVVGIFATNVYGVVGSVQLMLSHGVVSAALFILVGILYERHKVRLIKYYSGLVFLMPLFSVFMVIFTLANVAFPGLANFPGEFLIFVATANKNFSLALILSVGLFLTGVYSFWFLNRILFTVYNKYSTLPTQQFLDLNRREFWVLFILVIVNFLMGLFTRFFTLPVYIGLLLN